MRKLGLILVLAVLLVFLSSCLRENTVIGSVIRTKEIKDYEIEKCIASCEQIAQDNLQNCIDGCYFAVSDSYNDKNLCNKITDAELKDKCLAGK